MSEFAASLKELSGPRLSGDPVKAAIDRAAKLAGLSYTRAFDIWYRKARRIDAHEADAIREAVRLKREEDARHEYQELRTRLIKLESMLVKTDPNFHRAGADLGRAGRRAFG